MRPHTHVTQRMPRGALLRSISLRQFRRPQTARRATRQPAAFPYCCTSFAAALHVWAAQARHQRAAAAAGGVAAARSQRLDGAAVVADAQPCSYGHAQGRYQPGGRPAPQPRKCVPPCQLHTAPLFCHIFIFSYRFMLIGCCRCSATAQSSRWGAHVGTRLVPLVPSARPLRPAVHHLPAPFSSRIPLPGTAYDAPAQCICRAL